MLVISIITSLSTALGEGNFALHEPNFVGKDQLYLQAYIASSDVPSVGAFVYRFEKELPVFTGVRHAVAVLNGTAALQVALQLDSVQVNDEVKF